MHTKEMKFVNPWILVIYAFTIFVIVIARFKVVFIYQLILMAVAYILVTFAIKHSARE